MNWGDGFLARWSRRKLGAEREETPDAPEPRPDEAALATDETLPEEELALLPRIEDLTPESDISGFLRKGVPEVLRKAALRRMWSLDPAIRDYVGDARDYAWDWNVPGGVPGGGPLGLADDITDRLDRMFSALSDHAPGATPGRETGRGGPEAPEASPESRPEQVAAGGSPPAIPPSGTASPGEPAGGTGTAVAVSAREENAPDPAQRPLRRHGAAIPKFDLF
ncbi:DUF3306 domain-containing protein [Enterovirga aerilata]|uniref:DUF3306 domain-containing protein n=1 Tax=Enterovirga aerilata TaxID=2730920 RepID=A0A849I5S0_9HYPH|nr:DUF3306 domain-containing protein [Enterovirga sp. DB1703]NNM74812.1 DUF3306 domain-containing protein [Enterovirga sp. DB1703]